MQAVMDCLATLALYYGLIFFFFNEEALGDKYTQNKKGPNIVKIFIGNFIWKALPNSVD